MAASSLDASIIIGAAEPEQGWLQVSITFSRGGTEVGLGVGDSVQVNGVELGLTSVPFQPHTYSPAFDFKGAPSAYEFTYQHEGKSTSIRIPSLAAPKITSPQTGALVDRAGLTITYEPARGGNVSVMVYQTTANDSLALGAREEPDTGTYTFDTSMLTPLRPGPGWAWLELHQAVKTTPGDTGFKSVAITNNAAMATVQIRLQ
jgi:hypothetical protein